MSAGSVLWLTATMAMTSDYCPSDSVVNRVAARRQMSKSVRGGDPTAPRSISGGGGGSGAAAGGRIARSEHANVFVALTALPASSSRVAGTATEGGGFLRRLFDKQ